MAITWRDYYTNIILYNKLVFKLLAVVRCSCVWSSVVFFFDFLIITVSYPPHEHINACKI